MTTRRRVLLGAPLALVAGVAAGTRSARAAEAAGFAYTGNEKDNTVSVIDLASRKTVKTVPTGQRPRGIALTSDGGRLLVCLGNSNGISILNTKTWKQEGFIPTHDPEYAALRQPGNNPLYVSNEDDALITVWDIDTEKKLAEMPTGVEPEGMAVSPDGELICNTTETTGMAQFFEYKTGKNVANVLVPPRPRWAAFTHDGKEVWVSSEIGGTVTIIDCKTFKALDAIHFAVEGLRAGQFIHPVGINITHDDKLAFVCLGPANRVAVVDVASRKVKKYVLTGQMPWHACFASGEKYLLASNRLSHDVAFLRVSDLDVVDNVPVGKEPWMVVASES